MSKHVREKCGKLCISSILSSKRGITPTKLDTNWRPLNLICSTVKKSHMQIFSSICQSMLEKSVENWQRPGRTDGESDGRRPGRTDGWTVRYHHIIIHPVWRRTYKNESSIFNGLKVMAKVKVFVYTANADTDTNTRAMALAPQRFVPAH